MTMDPPTISSSERSAEHIIALSEQMLAALKQADVERAQALSTQRDAALRELSAPAGKLANAHWQQLTSRLQQLDQQLLEAATRLQSQYGDDLHQLQKSREGAHRYLNISGIEHDDQR